MLKKIHSKEEMRFPFTPPTPTLLVLWYKLGFRLIAVLPASPHLPTEKTGDAVDTDTLVLSTDLNYNSTEFYFLNKTRIDALNLRNKMFQNKDVQVFFFHCKTQTFLFSNDDTI